MEHWSILTLGQRLEAAARGLPAMVTGSVWARTSPATRLLDRRSPSARWASSLPWRPTWPSAMPRSPTPRETWPSPSRCSKEPGGPGQPDGAWWPRWRGSSTTSRSWAIGSGFPPTGCWPWSRHPSAPIPAAATPRACQWWGTARTSPSGSRPQPPPGRTSTAGPGEHLLDPPDHAGYLRLGDDRLIGLRLLSDPTRGARTPRPTRCRGRADQRLGGGRRLGPAKSGTRVRAPGRCRAGRGRGGQPGRLGGGGPGPGRRRVGVPHRRARPVGLHAHAGRPLHLQPRVFPGTSLLSDASTVLGMLVGGPGPSPSGASGRPRSTSGGTSTRPGWPTVGSWSGRAGPTTWSAGPRPAWW